MPAARHTEERLPNSGQQLVVEVVPVWVGDVQHTSLAAESLPVEMVIERVWRPRPEEAGMICMPRIADDLVVG